MRLTKKYLLNEASVNSDNPYEGLGEKPKDPRDTSVDSTNINQAILDDDVNGVKKIISQGVKPDERSFKYALIKKNPQVVDSIMKYLKKYDDMLTFAIKTKNPAIVNVVLKHGIKPDNSKRTLDHAIMTNNNEIVDEIIKNGGKPSPLSLFLAIMSDNPGIVKSVVEKGKDIPTQDNLIQARKRKSPNAEIIGYLNHYVMENNK